MTRSAFASFVAIILTGVAVLQAAPASDVTVHEENGIYLVTARFEVAAGPATALRVLTDYERIPEFAPGVKRSVVKDRQGNRAVVEQEAVSRVLLFSKRVHLVLDIAESEHSIEFRDICMRSFRSYTGSWQVHASGDRTTIVYELAAAPAFDVPQFVLTRVLKKDSTELIENLRREIERR
jgi:carbon monoxide dehydrogenase subunit G